MTRLNIWRSRRPVDLRGPLQPMSREADESAAMTSEDFPQVFL